jgi:D-alanyl-D-alanine endopeptidase (penicillin-binding protein 7)
MRRSRFSWLLPVWVLLMGFSLVLPSADMAEAATRKSTKRVSTTQRSTTTQTARVQKASGRGTRSVKVTRVSTRHYSSTRANARRARLARAKAAAYARDAVALREPLYKLDVNGNEVPDIRAEAAIIYNPITHQVLWEENSQSTRSIASITKVMTAVVFLEHVTDLSTEVVIEPADMRAASTTYLRANERVTPDTLLRLMLIGSDNAAARVLARVSPFGSAGFIDRMNMKAKELGLESTHYADPCGLNPDNVSSAYDMARLIAFAGNDERIASIMRRSEDIVSTSRRMVVVHNTNKLVGGDVDVRASKTGFIRQAGYCLATILQVPQGDPVAVVVLGARSNAGRFMETRHLFNWLSTRAGSLFKPAAVAAVDAPKGPDQPQQ